MNPNPGQPLRPQACILDLDGTLVDTLGDFVAVLGLTLTDLGLPAVNREFVEHTIGRGGENLVRQTLAHVGAEPALFDQSEEDGTVIVLNAEPTGELAEKAREAVKVCPSQALSIEE